MIGCIYLYSYVCCTSWLVALYFVMVALNFVVGCVVFYCIATECCHGCLLPGDGYVLVSQLILLFLHGNADWTAIT